MTRLRPYLITAMLAAALVGCTVQAGEERKPHATLFIGVDASGSFKHSGYYDNALTFLAHYIYGHLHELGGLEKPHSLFVASVGGKSVNEPKAFHPIHDFEGKDVAQIEADLRNWFPPSDKVTDFNPFFQEVARITKERNLILAPITLMVVTDGIPDAAIPEAKAGTRELYERIDLQPLEYLARNVTVRLTYVSPKVGEHWRTHVTRQRVRLWTVDAEVMKGWKNQMQAGVDVAQQDRFWKWVQDNVDFRVRANKA
ncbi:MAG TPA: hypothetical protein VES96_08100 [Nitrospiraceae bacterium]|nr:hypothetical protein [Nitrospiraceae bacterium]